MRLGWYIFSGFSKLHFFLFCVCVFSLSLYSHYTIHIIIPSWEKSESESPQAQVNWNLTLVYYIGYVWLILVSQCSSNFMFLFSVSVCSHSHLSFPLTIQFTIQFKYSHYILFINTHTTENNSHHKALHREMQVCTQHVRIVVLFHNDKKEMSS